MGRTVVIDDVTVAYRAGWPLVRDLSARVTPGAMLAVTATHDPEVAAACVAELRLADGRR